MMRSVSNVSEQVIKDPTAVRRSLGVFKVTAVLAGLAMFVLIAEMVMKYGYDNDALTWWSPVHGLIFMVFVFSVANLGLKVGWSMGRMAGIVVLACIPLVAFWVERSVAAEVEPRLAGSLSP